MIRNSFTKKKIGTLTLGERLKKFRTERRIPIQEVSRLTKIQAKYIEYLEEGYYDRLPADVYVRGFLRSYADFLGLDECVLLKIYEKEKGIKKNLENGQGKCLSKKENEPIRMSAFVFSPKKITLAIFFLAIISGVIFLSREIGSFTDAPRLIVLGPQENAEVADNSTTVFGITDVDARVFVNGQPIIVNDEGKFREDITLQSGINTINIKAVNRFEKDAVKQITVKSNAQEDVLFESSSEEENKIDESDFLEKKEMQMELRVDPGPVWVLVEADGSPVFSGTMLSGAVQSFRATDKIVISSGKASVTFIKFNGKDIGALSSEPGAVRGVIFDKNTKY